MLIMKENRGGDEEISMIRFAYQDAYVLTYKMVKNELKILL